MVVSGSFLLLLQPRVIESPMKLALCSPPAFNTLKLDHHEPDRSNCLVKVCGKHIRQKLYRLLACNLMQESFRNKVFKKKKVLQKKTKKKRFDSKLEHRESL